MEGKTCKPYAPHQHTSICPHQLFAIGRRHFKLRSLSPRILYATHHHATQTNNAVDAGCKCRILRSGVAWYVCEGLILQCMEVVFCETQSKYLALALIKLGVVRGKFGSAVGSKHSHTHNHLVSTLAVYSAISVAWHTNCIGNKCANKGWGVN